MIMRSAILHRDGIPCTPAHDWIMEPTAARPVCRPNCWIWTVGERSISLLYSDTPCPECIALRNDPSTTQRVRMVRSDH